MQSNRKKVLLIGSELGKGGAERSISLLSHHLSADYDVTLCILSGQSTESFYKTGGDIVFITPPVSSNILGKARAWLYRYKKLKAIKRELGIDVAISFLEGPSYMNVLTRGKEKVVLSVRGSMQFDQEISGVKGFMRRKLFIPLLFRFADHIVCVTDSLATEMRKNFFIPWKKLSVIHNFYEQEEIIRRHDEALSPAEEKLFDKPVIINSGRLHMQKEQDKLLHVFAEVRKRVDCRLLILGDGELKQSLIALAADLGLSICCWDPAVNNPQADVCLMGFQANPFKFYRRSKLFSLSSSWEGFPNVLAEAIICRLPVMSADCPTGPKEILRVLTPGNDPIEDPIRTRVGSLMPLLNPLLPSRLESWVEEAVYWLHKPETDKQAFHKLVEQYQPAPITRKWRSLIDDLRIYSSETSGQSDLKKAPAGTVDSLLTA